MFDLPFNRIVLSVDCLSILVLHLSARHEACFNMASCTTVFGRASSATLQRAASGRAFAARSVRPCVHRAAQRSSLSRRAGACVVRAEFQDGPQETPLSRFLQKYDFMSAMMGALIVTGFFWSTGQDPLQALSITACSTVFAVVANELLFPGADDQL